MVWAKSMSRNILINFVIALSLVVFASKVNAGCYHSDNYESNGEPIPQVSICTLNSCEAVSYVTMCGNVHGIFEVHSGANLIYRIDCTTTVYGSGYDTVTTANKCWVSSYRLHEEPIRIDERALIDLTCTKLTANADCSWITSFGATELEKQTSLKSELYARPIRRPTG